MKHTPAPWRIATSGRAVLTQDGTTFIADCENPQNPNKGEQYSNALLCAAAPDLLAALKALMAYGDLDGAEQVKVDHQVRAAIAKAGGALV